MTPTSQNRETRKGQGRAEMQRFAKMLSESSVPDSDWTQVVLERRRREQKAAKKARGEKNEPMDD